MGSPAILQLLLIVNVNIHLGGSAVRDQLHNHHSHMSSDPAWKQRQHTVKPSSFPCSPGLTTSISNQDRQHDERSEELESETSSNYPDVGSKRYYTFRDSAYRLSRESAGTSTKENNADSTEDFDSIAPPSKRTSDQRLGWLESMKKFRDGKTVTASVDRGGRMRRDRFVRSVRGETSPASVTKFYTVSQSRAPSPMEQVSKEKDSAEPPQYAAQTGRDYTERVPGGSGEVFRLEIPPLAADGGITGNGLRAVDRPKCPINGDRDVAVVYSGGSSDRLVSTSASDGEIALNFSTSPSYEDGGDYGKSTSTSPRATSSIPDKTDGSRNYTNVLYEVDGYLARNTPSLPNDNSISHAALQQREEVVTSAFEFDSEKQKTAASSGEDVDTHGTVPVATTSSATTSNVLLLETKDDTAGSGRSSSTTLQRFNKDLSVFRLITESAASTLQEPRLSAKKSTADSRINGIYVGTTSSISERATNDDTSANGYQLNAHLSDTESEKVTEAISETPRENLRPDSTANKHLVSFQDYLWNGGMQNDGPAISITAATEQQENRALKGPPSIPMYTKKPLLYNNEHYSMFTTNRVSDKLVTLVLSATPKKVNRPVDNWSVTSLPSATEPMAASVPPTETETLPFEETGGKYRTAEEVYTTDIADASVVSAETESYLDFKSTDANLEDASNDTLDSTGGNSSAAKSGASGNDSVSGWPVKLSAVVEGELVLGGLMMVHERSDTVTCGPVMPQGGVQALETMLYTLDRINAHPSLLPNVTIGAHILDDCDKDTYGLEMAVDFIKGKCRPCNRR